MNRNWDNCGSGTRKQEIWLYVFYVPEDWSASGIVPSGEGGEG